MQNKYQAFVTINNAVTRCGVKDIIIVTFFDRVVNFFNRKKQWTVEMLDLDAAEVLTRCNTPDEFIAALEKMC